MAAQNSWHRLFSGSMSQIPAAGSWIESIAADLDLPGPRVFAMQVCLEEIMSNIVQHGGAQSSSRSYRPQTDQANPLVISITVSALADRVIMTVEDNGRPFDVAQAPAKGIDQPLDQIQPGGMGIQLIKSFASSFKYRRTGKGNRVIVEFMA
jgi:serine/threonine-protein kinase RsbW